jgi:ABC-2 type transport system ATP-binding protein
MSAVIVDNVIKKYGSKKEQVTALKGVSIDVKKGELFGIIGPDGAGKTSLFRVLTTLLLPDGGRATVDGMDVVKDYKAIRQHVGYMPGRFSLYQDLTVAENMEFFATIFNTTIEENYDLVKEIYSQIEPFKDRRAGKLSGGMKQKLALSCALIHRPSVLFLDEPTTGVDAVSRKEFWEMLKRLKEQGITILVSTPYMDEASMCDRVALIQSGEIMSVDTPQGIIDQFKNPLVAVKAPAMLHLLNDLKEFPGQLDAYPFGEFHHVVLKEGNSKNDIDNHLESKGWQNIEIKTVTADIEDCFIALMKDA